MKYCVMADTHTWKTTTFLRYNILHAVVLGCVDLYLPHFTELQLVCLNEMYVCISVQFPACNMVHFSSHEIRKTLFKLLYVWALTLYSRLSLLNVQCPSRLPLRRDSWLQFWLPVLCSPSATPPPDLSPC